MIRPDPDGWQCFARDPATPDSAVAFTEQRFLPDRIEVNTVFTNGEAGSASRLTLTKVDDHFEEHLPAGDYTAQLLLESGAHWTLSYREHKGDRAADEDSVVENGVLTVTSMYGDGTKTVTRLVPASCDDVVAALAKYPQP